MAVIKYHWRAGSKCAPKPRSLSQPGFSNGKLGMPRSLPWSASFGYGHRQGMKRREGPLSPGGSVLALFSCVRFLLLDFTSLCQLVHNRHTCSVESMCLLYLFYPSHVLLYVHICFVTLSLAHQVFVEH